LAEFEAEPQGLKNGAAEEKAGAKPHAALLPGGERPALTEPAGEIRRKVGACPDRQKANQKPVEIAT
jgi:hypothetical protein